MSGEHSIRIDVLKDLLKEAHSVYFWEYDPEMELVSTNYENDLLISPLFTVDGTAETIRKAAIRSPLPVLVSDSLLLLWLAIPVVQDSVLKNIYVLGPVFGSYTSENTVTAGLGKLNISSTLKTPILEQIRTLPVMLRTTLLSYGILFYNCLYQEKIEEADIRLHTNNTNMPIPSIRSEEENRIVENSYPFEKRYFSAVMEGNIYFKAPSYYDPSMLGRLADTPIRHAKNQMIVKITLACRAAMAGGLPSSIAYAISDQFIQSLEETNNIHDIYNLGQLCVQEYTQRVHKLREAQDQGHNLHRCFAYIDAHLLEKIDYETMSQELGYNRQYLSAKFKRETGRTMSNYITEKRIEFSKTLLLHSSYSMLEISQMLQFSSCSYFSAQFRKLTGMTPSDYQNKEWIPDV